MVVYIFSCCLVFRRSLDGFSFGFPEFFRASQGFTAPAAAIFFSASQTSLSKYLRCRPNLILASRPSRCRRRTVS